MLTFFVVISFIKSRDHEYADNKILDYSFNYFLPLIFIPLTTSFRTINKFYKVWVFFAIMSAILTILQVLFGEMFYIQKYLGDPFASIKFQAYSLETGEYSGFGLFGHRSHNALFQSVAIYYLLIKGLRNKLSLKFSILLIIPLLVGIILTRARGGLILFLFGLMLLFYLILYKRFVNIKISIIYRFIIFALIIFISKYFIHWDKIINPILSRFGSHSYMYFLANNERFYSWNMYLKINGLKYTDLFHPLGLGFGKSPPDNVYFTVGFELGFIALIVFFSIQVLFLKEALKSYKRTIRKPLEDEYLCTFFAILIFSLHFFIGNLYFYEQIFIQIAPFVFLLSLKYYEAKLNVIKDDSVAHVILPQKLM